MKNKKIILIIILIVLFVSYNVYILFDKYGVYLIGNSTETYRYESNNGLYSIVIPTSWTINEIKTPLSVDKLLVTTFSTFNSKVFMNVHKLNNPLLSQEELVNHELEMVSDFNNLVITENSTNSQNNKIGTLLEYSYIRDHRNYLNHCYDWISSENSGYVFTFCSEEKLWKNAQPMFNDMINSISLDNHN